MPNGWDPVPVQKKRTKRTRTKTQARGGRPIGEPNGQPLAALDAQTQEYRMFLLEADRKTQEDYDKAILSLAAGALGISIAFVKDIIGDVPATRPDLLAVAWAAWASSIACALVSLYSARFAIRKAISQVDGTGPSHERVGGRASLLTSSLNALAGALFLAGVVFMSVFAINNLR